MIETKHFEPAFGDGDENTVRLSVDWDAGSFTMEYCTDSGHETAVWNISNHPPEPPELEDVLESYRANYILRSSATNPKHAKVEALSLAQHIASTEDVTVEHEKTFQRARGFGAVARALGDRILRRLGVRA